MKTLTEHAKAAKSIKAELKAAFPTTKFSVKSDSYSGGDSVRISYEDGPLYEKVKTIVDKYQYGSFNGMEDIYEYNDTNSDLPQVKYVLVQRDLSEATTLNLIKEVEEMYSTPRLSIDNYYNVVVSGFGEYASVLVRRLFFQREYLA